MGGKFPKAYTGDVSVDRGLMEYTTFEKMGIGARPSGLPKNGPNDIKSLEHVDKNGSVGEAKRAK